jgi:hypothetical protein
VCEPSLIYTRIHICIHIYIYVYIYVLLHIRSFAFVIAEASSDNLHAEYVPKIETGTGAK